jgi:hypothetical protein
MMSATLSTTLRRGVLLGAPLALGLLNATHPGPDPANPSATMFQSLLAQGQVDWFITSHLIQTILLGFMGLAIWLLADGLSGPAVALSRFGVWTFLIVYSAFDSVAGVATGYFVRYGSALPIEQQVVADSIVEAFIVDPVVGTATVSILGGAASLAWLVAALPVAIALGRAGASRLSVALLVLGTLGFGVGHPAPTGPIGMALFLAGTALLEFGGNRRAACRRGQVRRLASSSAVS